MGLDMYLFKTKKKIDIKNQLVIDLVFDIYKYKNINDSVLKTYFEDSIYEDGCLCEEVGYWRKANMIHGWFVNNCNNRIYELANVDYMPIEIEIEKIEELLSVCNKVYENRGNVEIAREYLPVCKGFFFGSYEYDDSYYSDIELTKKILEKLLTNHNSNEIYFYYANY